MSENSKNGRNSGKSGRDSRSRAGTNIRTAELADLAELVRIYNHYVENTAVTFDTMAYTPDARRTWLNSFRHEGPYRLLVAENDGHLLGYASSSRFNRDLPRSGLQVRRVLGRSLVREGPVPLVLSQEVMVE